MIDSVFTKIDSLIARTDPRVRIIYAMFFSVIVALIDKHYVAGLAFILSVITVITARLKLQLVLKRLLIVNIFIFALWFILPFSMSGHTVFSLGRFNMSQEGLLYVLLITLKCNAIVISWTALISTCSIFELVHAFAHIRLPDKLIYLFFLLYRYVFTVQAEYRTLMNTLKIRGFRPRTTLHTYRTYGYIIGTLWLRSFDRSEQVHKAMVCRGFKGKYWLLDHFKAMHMDIIIGTSMLFIIIILGVLQWTQIVH